jgi:hypothetical protein
MFDDVKPDRVVFPVNCAVISVSCGYMFLLVITSHGVSVKWIILVSAFVSV